MDPIAEYVEVTRQQLANPIVMNTPSQSDTLDIDIDRPPPLIPGLCSVQAAGANPASPILTIYRKEASTAADWIAEAALDKRFDAYLRRRGDGYWEGWNVHGKPTYGGNTLPVIPFRELTTSVAVYRAAFIQEARGSIGDAELTLLACAEGHAGASAADHANFKVVCCRMIEEAAPADLEQIYLIDSRKWPCRVTGVFANVANLSPGMQDIFLDRLKWIRNSWPLVVRDFHEILADRLATVRIDYTHGLLLDCARAAGFPENQIIGLRSKWMMASPGPKYRLALHLVETLHEGLITEKNSAESFSPEIVKRYGAKVVKDYKRRLTVGLG